MTLQNSEISIIWFYFSCRHKLEADLSMIYTELESLFEKDHLPNDLHEWSELCKTGNEMTKFHFDSFLKLGEFKPTHAKNIYAYCRNMLQIDSNDLSKELETIFGAKEIDLNNLKKWDRKYSNDQRIDDFYAENGAASPFNNSVKTLKIKVSSLRRLSFNNNNDSLEEQLRLAINKVHQLQDKIATMRLQLETQQNNNNNKHGKSKFSSDMFNVKSPNANEQLNDATVSVDMMQINEKHKTFESELRLSQDQLAKVKLENTFFIAENKKLGVNSKQINAINSALNSKLIEMTNSSKKHEELLKTVMDKHQTELSSLQAQLNQRNGELLSSEKMLDEIRRDFEQVTQELKKLQNTNKLQKDTIEKLQSAHPATSPDQTTIVKQEFTDEIIVLKQKLDKARSECKKARSEYKKAKEYNAIYIQQMREKSEEFKKILVKKKEEYYQISFKQTQTEDDNIKLKELLSHIERAWSS